MTRLRLASALLAFGTLVGASLPAFASDDAISDAIRYRQAGYTFMSWNMGKIKAQVVDEKVAFNPDQIRAAANAIAAIANSGMGALYPPGSDQGKGFSETRLKPEFFTRMDDVRKVAMDFNQAANRLAEAAATGDQAAIKLAFGETGKSCKACHDQFRAEKDESHDHKH